MTWPNRCGARPDDGGDTTHCFHPTPPDQLVCCWCGDLFLADEPQDGHGEYAPKSGLDELIAKLEEKPGVPENVEISQSLLDNLLLEDS